MPAWLWITSLAAVAFVLWVVVAALLAPVVGRVLRARRYELEDARHVAAQPPPLGPAPEYGSMSLSHEQMLHHELPWLPAPPVDPDPWLTRLPDAAERTELLAGLAPEALEPPCPHEYTPNVTGTHEWCQICDSVRTVDSLPEIVLPDAGGWISGPCLDDPGPGDGESSLASSGPGQPSRWLTEQLEILHAWAERQQRYAEILA